jgi:hypothetical protein
VWCLRENNGNYKSLRFSTVVNDQQQCNRFIQRFALSVCLSCVNALHCCVVWCCLLLIVCVLLKQCVNCNERVNFAQVHIKYMQCNTTPKVASTRCKAAMDRLSLERARHANQVCVLCKVRRAQPPQLLACHLHTHTHLHKRCSLLLLLRQLLLLQRPSISTCS